MYVYLHVYFKCMHVYFLCIYMYDILYLVFYLYMFVGYFGVSSFLILYMSVTVLCVTWSFNFLEGTSQKDE